MPSALFSCFTASTGLQLDGHQQIHRWHWRTRARSLLTLLLLACVPFSGAQAAVALLTVGSGADCDFRTDLLPNALQSAIDAVPVSVPPADLYVIRVARNGSYVGVPLEIMDRTLLIEGGYTDCLDAVPDNTNTVIDGNSALAIPVLTIDGMTSRETITLSRMNITGGSGNNGSGIRINNADVRLSGTTVSNNSGAIRGAGIDIRGGGFGASLQMYGNAGVTNNDATQEGGGISCTQGAELMLESDSAVTGNTAAVYGGGIYANGCTGYVNSGADGLAGLFVNLGFNTAGYGGGLAVRSDTLPTDITIGEGIGASDPHPLLTNNTGSVAGGGVYATGADSTVRILNANIISNEATSYGGGVHAHGSSRILLAGTHRSCIGGGACSTLTDNSANQGAAISSAFGGAVVAYGIRFQGNTASQDGSVAMAMNADATIFIRNSFLIGNTGPSVLLSSPYSVSEPRAASVWLLSSTVADNNGVANVIQLNDVGVALVGRSIIQDASGTVVHRTAANPATQMDMSCNLFHEIVSVPDADSQTGISTNPGFVNAAGGNYHLLATANATDRCAANGFFYPVDYDGDARPVDAPLPDLAGPYDVGADEWSATIFRDSYERPIILDALY